MSLDVSVCRILTAFSDWLSDGGLFIIAGCLASIATIIVVLSVAVCLVRTRSRRRRRKMLAVTTKIELQESPPSDEPTPPAHDRLLAGQMSDVALNEFESQPVRYVVGLPLLVPPIVHSIIITTSQIRGRSASPCSTHRTQHHHHNQSDTW